MIRIVILSLGIALATLLFVAHRTCILIKRRFVFGDVAFHIKLVEDIRRVRVNHAKPTWNLMPAERDDYPNLYHRVLAVFPQKWVQDQSPVFPASIVAGTLALMSLIIYTLIGNVEVAFLFSLLWFPIFFLAPSVTNAASGLVFSISERGLAKGSLTLVFAGVLASVSQTGSRATIFAVFAIVSCAVAWQVSLFSRQVLTFVLLPSSFVSLTFGDIHAGITGLVVFSGGFGLALLPAGNLIRFSLPAQLRFIVAYKRFTASSKPFWDSPTSSSGWRDTFSDWIGLVAYPRHLIMLGWIVGALVGPILLALVAGEIPSETWVFSVILVVLVVGSATTLTPLRFLGEGWRYLDFTLSGVAAVAWGRFLSASDHAPLASLVLAFWIVLPVIYMGFRDQLSTSSLESDYRLIGRDLAANGFDKALVLPQNEAIGFNLVTSVRTWSLPGMYNSSHSGWLSHYPLMSPDLLASFVTENACVVVVNLDCSGVPELLESTTELMEAELTTISIHGTCVAFSLQWEHN